MDMEDYKTCLESKETIDKKIDSGLNIEFGTPQDPSNPGSIDKHREFYDRLSCEEKLLIILKSKLYGNSWDKLIEDQKNRTKNEPYVFKIISEKDVQKMIDSAEKIRLYEKDNQGADIILLNYAKNDKSLESNRKKGCLH